MRTGLRDRTYTWAQPDANPSDELVEVPVRHGAERIGSIAVDHAAVAGVHRQRWNLLEDIAESLGVVLQASRVGIELERQLRAAVAHANEIAVSRRGVVAEMDAERRRIERDLHDGAQHHLVSLRLALGLVEHLVSTAQSGEARARLEQIAHQIDTVETVLAETAAGVSSPMLAELGLVGALEKELGGPEPVRVHADPAIASRGRLPSQLETAVYFCCLEAVNNARKHARGAAIAVHLRIEDGRLRFTVTDDGPGYDPAANAGSPGRGLRNVRARITAVGGRIEVRSSPGAGTTVEGWAPLPPPEQMAPEEAAPEEAAPPAEPAPVATATAHPDPLAEQVRRAVQAAIEDYEGTPHASAVRALAARFDQPLRVSVLGASGSGPQIVADGLEGVSESVQITVADPTADLGDGSPEHWTDAFVLLVRHGHPEDVARSATVHEAAAAHRPALAITVLVIDRDAVDEEAVDVDHAAEALAAHPEVRRLSGAVVPVDLRLVRAAATVTDADAPPETVPRVAVALGGSAGLRQAGAPGRFGGGQGSAALAEKLRQRSGLPRLRDLVDARFARRAASLKARSVLLALEQLARTAPVPGGAGRLRYELDRIRSGAHELTEIDTVDALLAGALDVPDEDRALAARLLGATGSAPAARLALPPEADTEAVAASAAAELARWRRRALHPTATADLRTVAEVVVRTCEHLLADARGE
jgi:signal transduction histidine kinase